MRTNIMLCFLSDVKLVRETGAISGVDYQNIGEKKDAIRQMNLPSAIF